jgi:hypothetical protein
MPEAAVATMKRHTEVCIGSISCMSVSGAELLQVHPTTMLARLGSAAAAAAGALKVPA